MKYDKKYYNTYHANISGGTLDVFLHVKQWLPEHPIIVDLGCSNGMFAMIPKDVERYIGYDISDVAIGKAQAIGLGDKYLFCCADIVNDAIEIPAGAIVTSFQTIEHLCLPDGDLRLIKKLPIGTRFIFSVPIRSLGGSHLRAYRNIGDAVEQYNEYLIFNRMDKIELLHRGKEPRKNDKRSYRYVYDTERRGKD